MPSTIGPGSTGDDVKRLQRVLARHLLWNPFGPITGVFDASLETAVKSFQQSNGLTQDGVVGPATWAKLPAYREASPTLESGSTGPGVAFLQRVLNGSAIVIAFPAYTGAVDGVMGPQTVAALKGLQTWAKIPATGVADDATWFIWLTPGSAQQLTVEGACGFTDNLL
jgi:peptidoglycan hydrolase-like protein with peptidoglycan-binding domain